MYILVVYMYVLVILYVSVVDQPCALARRCVEEPGRYTGYAPRYVHLPTDYGEKQTFIACTPCRYGT